MKQTSVIIYYKEVKKDDKTFRNYFIKGEGDKPVAIRLCFNEKMDRYLLNKVAYNYEDIKQVFDNN